MGNKAKQKHTEETQQKTYAPDTTALVPQGSNSAPDFLVAAAQQDAGKGVSTLAEDNLVPLIYVLQSNSPQVIPRNPKQVEGAAAGDIWLKAMSSEDSVIRGDEGMWFIPVWFAKSCIEWVPRSAGGGFVARHNEMPKSARQVPHPEWPDTLIWTLPNGNEVREVREHAGYVITPKGRFPYVLSLSGSGHSFSKAWMTVMGSKRIPGAEASLPSFACAYRLRTNIRKNKKGEWFMYEIASDRYVSADEYAASRNLYEQFSQGIKQAAAPEADHDEAREEVPF
jgi:hypothetical protein